MRLRALTLQGFKSFGDRTRLEFDPGVTAIVGPNGSGKSNVIDALRWAGSGGRASSFRAVDQTELIFHGAAGKRSVSFAEVTVELEGDTNLTNLTIARSIFRDGQTKLRLGGKNARFLDIDEALAGSGLGRGGLSVIGQGEVSGVLMADGETLLAYVAEAAGVARLASRREQTEARLAVTHDHLTRLQDIAHELGRQHAQLSHEAAEAERATRLGRERLQLRYTLAEQRVTGLAEEVATLTREHGHAERGLQTGQAEVSAAQTRWHTARQRSHDAEAVYRHALAEAETRKGDVRVARERLHAAEVYTQALAREAAQLSATQADLETDLEATPPAEAEAIDLGVLETDVEAAEAQVQASRSALGEAEEAFEMQRQRVTHARQAVAAHSQAVQLFERQQQELAAQLAEVRGRLASLRAATEAGEEAALEARWHSQQQALAAQQEALEASTLQLQRLQQRHAHAHAEAQALSRAAQRARRALEAREGYAKGPKSALTSGVAGVVGAVADLIRVAPSYQTAISSALGRRIEHVVVDSADTAQQVLARVRRAGGWVTLLPLDLITAREGRLAPALAAEASCLGLCSDVVDSDARYHALVAQLLGGTALIRTLDEAVALARRYPQRPRFVTLEGDLLEAYGAISGGQRQQGAGLLGAAADVADAETAAKQAEAEAEAAGQALREAQTQHKTRQEQQRVAETQHRHTQQALTHAREAAAGRASLRTELRAREEVHEARLAQLTPPAPRDAQTNVARLEASLETAGRDLSAHREAVARATQAHATAAQALAVARAQAKSIAAVRRRYQEAQRRLGEVSARQAQLAAEQTDAATQREGARTALAQAEAALPTDLETQHTHYHQALEESRAAEAQLDTLSQQQAARSGVLETLSLSLARREAALELAKEELAPFPMGLTPLEGATKALRAHLAEVEQGLETLGPVNHRAAQEAQEQGRRLAELEAQLAEAKAATDELSGVLGDLKGEVTGRLNTALARLQESFGRYAQTLFGGGEAAVEVHYQEDEPVGLGIRLQPPGKQTRALNLLSVGERTMGALAFLFALMADGEAKGLPIAILDEVDAPLDEANIRRFCAFVTRLAEHGTQFILISHQKATMETADALWGVTTEGGVSRVFSISKHESAVA